MRFSRSILVMCSSLLALGACGLVTDSAVDGASAVIQQSLQAPDTFSLKKGKVLWKGKNKNGNEAYIVEVAYTAQNLFGATLSGCQAIAFFRDNGKFKWKKEFGVTPCFETSDELTRQMLNNDKDRWLKEFGEDNDIEM